MRKLTALLCLLVASVASAQGLVIGNASHGHQLRWATAVVPNELAESWPDKGVIGGNIYVKSKKTRKAGTNVYVLVNLPPHGVIALQGPPKAADLPKPVASSLLNPMFAEPLLLRAGGVEVPLELDNLEIEGSFRVRGLFSARANGIVARLVVDAYAWQDTVDLAGFVVFSDRTTDELNSTVAGSQVSIVVPTGSVHLYYSKPWGQAGSGTREFKPFNDSRPLPDGMAIPFYGAYLPDMPPELPQGDWLRSLRELRVQALEGAKHGPVVADMNAYKRQGHWFGPGNFYELPRVPVSVPVSRWQAFYTRLQSSGSVLDQRQYAAPLTTGQAGTHKPMGMFKSVELLQHGDPRFIHQLRESTADHLLRGWHHYESDRSIVRAAAHPGWRTWSGLTHFTSSDTLGKGDGRQPWGFGFSRIAADDQHWVSSYSHAVRAVTDDPILEISAKHYMETTAARAFRRQNRTDAPRAGARLLKNWAWEYWNTFDDYYRQLSITLSREEIDLWWDRTESRPGPLKIANIQGPDGRVLPDHESWVPWQEALLCGAAAITAATFAEDAPALADKAHKLAVRLGENIARGGLIRDTVTGELYPMTGVKWLTGGHLNPPEYYEFPRAGASFSSGPGNDALVGTMGWHIGMGQPACYQYTHKHSTDPNVTATLGEVLSTVGPAGSAGQAEWRFD